MSKNEVFKNGYEACLKNAELWLNEGNLLFNQGSYGHACALYIHGLEGIIHSWWSWLVYIEAIMPDNRDFLSTFKNHEPKLLSFWGIFFGHQLQFVEHDYAFEDDEKTWKDVEKELKIFNSTLTRLSHETLKLRNRSIYIDYSPDKNIFSSPLDITKDDVHAFIEVILNVIERIIYFIRNSNEKEQEIIKRIYQELYKE